MTNSFSAKPALEPSLLTRLTWLQMAIWHKAARDRWSIVNPVVLCFSMMMEPFPDLAQVATDSNYRCFPIDTK
ncbi:MAG: hypothetical protein IGS48_14565 [Oscillatoriales cyanobacterium C42_A2020_001]|nr:hypothetical protein [Leptolyngbyaceae cyanobacterium C42_A2020_001]